MSNLIKRNDIYPLIKINTYKEINNKIILHLNFLTRCRTKGTYGLYYLSYVVIKNSLDITNLSTQEEYELILQTQSKFHAEVYNFINLAKIEPLTSILDDINKTKMFQLDDNQESEEERIKKFII